MSLLGWRTMRATPTTVPPDVRNRDPIRIWKPLLDTQCLAVTTQRDEISEPPQKCRLPDCCSDTMNEYVWVASWPPMMVASTSSDRTAARAATVPAATAAAATNTAAVLTSQRRTRVAAGARTFGRREDPKLEVPLIHTSSWDPG